MPRRFLAAMTAAPLLAAVLVITASSAQPAPPARARPALALTTAPEPPPPSCTAVEMDVPAVQLDPALLASSASVAALQRAVGVADDSVFGPLTTAAIPARAPATICSPAFAVQSPLLEAVAAVNAEAADLTAEREAAAAASRVARAASPRPSPTSSGPANWAGVAQCETGGNWQMQGPTFSGGLGFANSSWEAFGGLEFSPNAGLATPAQQIIVAERIRAYNGGSLYGAWGCAGAG